MTAIVKTRHGHDDIYEATGATAIDGGMLVVPAAGATNAGVQGIDIAGAAATNVLGVAARRAEKLSLQSLTGTDADGFPLTYPNPVNELTTVYKQCVVPVTYTAVAVAHGVKLQSAANGAVAAWVVQGAAYAQGAGNANTIVGECRVVGGMGSAGGIGLAYIY